MDIEKLFGMGSVRVMNKVLIKSGEIMDGTGRNSFIGDIEIIGDTITVIGDIGEKEGYEVIDAKGRIVCPGFIDTHSHSDVALLLDPYVEPKIRQGITTEVLGQDGISAAPTPKAYVDAWRKNISGLDGDSSELSWDFETGEKYYKSIEAKGNATNVMYLVPHGNIRMEAMGLTNAKPGVYEIEKMKAITRRELSTGAAGISSGLIYPPCNYSDKWELIEICKVAAEFKRPFVVHQRSEADTILDSMDEIIEVGRLSGVKIHFSHFKICGKKNWDKLQAVLDKLDKAQAEGVKVSFDQYPYCAGSTMLGVLLPPWAHEGGTNKLLDRLKDKDCRSRMKQDIENGIKGWDNFVDFAGFDNIYVTSVKTEKNEECIGKNLLQIAELKSKDVYEALFDLLLEEDNAVGMYDYYGKEEHIQAFMKRKEQNFCTDGLLAGKPHPRVYGAFPRVLSKYVREEGALSLEEAIYKMTGKPRQVLGLKDRGLLKTGFKADVVIFDRDTVKDNATFEDPIQFPSGIEHVLVNGIHILNSGIRSRDLSGQIIRL